MKRTIALAILGAAAVTTAFGQGHVDISNYLVAPYNQVVWDASYPVLGGTAVNNTAVQLQIWYGLGVVTDANALTAGVTFAVNPGFAFDPGAGFGGGGYFGATTQAGLTPDVVYTFQIRASGDIGAGPLAGASALYQATPGVVANPPPIAQISPGLAVSIVPEPTTFALAGLGAAALLIFRRRD
jgi:hypothetical protein